MATVNRYKVLFFIPAMSPTAQQLSEAFNFGPHVMFRNANAISPDDNVEDCIAVYGPAVPPRYAARFPWACSIVDFYAGKLDIAPMAAPVVPDTSLARGATNTASVDPFASVNAADRQRADWKAQG